MADNVTVPGTGEILGFDEVGGAKIARSKTGFGPDGSYADVADAAGARLPVKLGAGLEAAAIVAGQATVTEAEAALPTAVARRFRVRSLMSNTALVYLGPTGVTEANGYPLGIGDVTPALELSNLNVVFAITPAGTTAVLAYLGEV